jgi:hypothetical protein
MHTSTQSFSHFFLEVAFASTTLLHPNTSDSDFLNYLRSRSDPMSGYRLSFPVSNNTMAPDSNTDQAANMFERKACYSTNTKNTSVDYSTWTAAVGDMAGFNDPDWNVANGGDAAHPAQPQPFDDSDHGYIDLLSQLPGYNNLSQNSPPTNGTAGDVAQQDCNLDRSHYESYHTHPYTPGQGYVQQDGTHYLPQSPSQPEFIEHHHNDTQEINLPTSSEAGAPPIHPDWHNQPMVGEQAPDGYAGLNERIEFGNTHPLYTLLGHPVAEHGSSPPRHNESHEHISQNAQLQPSLNGVAPLILPADGRYPHPQCERGPQCSTAISAFQPQGSQAQLAPPEVYPQLALPQMQRPDVGVEYVSDDVLLQAAGVAQPPQATQSRKLAFSNLTQAKTAMAGRKLKQDWKPDPQDNTRPQNDQHRTAYVTQLLDALEDITQSTDSQAPNTAFSKRWANHITSPYYHPEEMETVCWKIQDIAERLHTHGPATLFVYDPPSLADIAKSRGMKFATRIDAICDLLRQSKARCDKLMKGEGLETVVGAPKQKMVNVKTNKVQNEQRSRLIGEGRKVVRAAKDAKAPTRSTADRNSANNAGQQQPALGKGRKTPAKAEQSPTATEQPTNVEEFKPDGPTEYPYAPHNSGRPGAFQGFNGLYAHLYPPQANTQHFAQFQAVYGSPGNVLTQAYVANQSVSNYGPNHIYGHPQPAPYLQGVAQYAPSFYEPAVSHFQRLPSSPRFTARPPTGQPQSPVDSPPQVIRKRSVGEVETGGSVAQNKRQRTV